MFALVKKRELESGEIMLMRRGFGWYVIPMLVIPPLQIWLLAGIIFPGLKPWQDWKLLDNELHEIESEVKENVDRIRMSLSERREVLDRLKREKEEIKKNLSKNGRTSFKESTPFLYRIKLREWLLWCKQRELSPVDPEWKKSLNKDLLSDKKKPQTAVDAIFSKELGIDLDSSNSESATTVGAIAPEEFSMYLTNDIEGEMDINYFKTKDPQRNNNNPQGKKLNHLKGNKPKGVPQEHWDNFINGMKDDGFIDK